MRTLEDKKKLNQNKRQENKQQVPRRAVKTTFFEPYTYKLEVLAHEDAMQVKELVVPYLRELRRIQPQNKNKVFNEAARQKVISFKNKIQKPSALHEPHCVIGIKCVLKKVQSERPPDIVIIYFDPKQYDLFQQLFINLITKKIKYLLLRSNQQKIEIARQMGINVLNAYGLYVMKGWEQTIEKLIILAVRCFVEVQFVFQNVLEGAKIQETTTTVAKQ